jgi:hypothetical protein
LNLQRQETQIPFGKGKRERQAKAFNAEVARKNAKVAEENKQRQTQIPFGNDKQKWQTKMTNKYVVRIQTDPLPEGRKGSRRKTKAISWWGC